MKNYLKFLLMFGISFLLFNCESDNNIDEIITSETGNNLAFKKERFQDLEKLTSYVEELKRNRRGSSINSESSLGNTNDFIIIEDQDVLVYEQETNTSYTIPILKTQQEIGTFSNLVVKFSDTEPTEAFILNYEPSEGFLEAAENYDQTPFSGSITRTLIDYDGSLDNLTENANPDLNCTTITIKFCNWSEGNVEGTTHLAGVNCTPRFMFDFSYEVCSDFPELVDPPSSSSGSDSPSDGFPNTPSGGNTSSDGNYDNTVTIPTVPRVETTLDVSGITLEMNDWLNSHLDIKLELITIFDENLEAEDFILEAILELMADENLTLEEYLAQQILVNAPEIEINDIEDYLDCFDISQPAELTIYVEQPVEGDRKPYKIGGLNFIDVGHAFVQITQGETTRVLGLYPQGLAKPNNPQDTSVYGNDAFHDFNVSITKDISPTELSNIINETVQNEDDYNLNSNNCSNYAIRIGNIGGINLPSTIGTWPNGTGTNPGDLGEDIRETEQPNITPNENGGTAPDNNGTC